MPPRPQPGGGGGGTANIGTSGDGSSSTGLSLEITCAFGSRCGAGPPSEAPRDAVLFGDEDGQYLVHPVGRHIAFRRLDTGDTNFADIGDGVESLTACAVSSDHRFFAVCQLCEAGASTQVAVYDLRATSSTPTQTLEGLEGRPVGRLICAAFSHDLPAADSLLCLASALPDLALLVVDWRANRILGKCVLPGPPERVALAPPDSMIVSVSGIDYLQFWATYEGELQPLPEMSGFDPAGYEFADHCWLEPGDGTLAVCTINGPILICSCAVAIEHMQRLRQEGTVTLEDVPGPRILRTIDQPFGPAFANAAAGCIRSFPHGFVLGTSISAVAVWERERKITPTVNASRQENSEEDVEEDIEVDRASMWDRSCTMQTRQSDAAVCCLDVTGSHNSETRLALGFDDATIGYIDLDSLRNSYSEQMIACTIVSGGFHKSSITSLDMAAQRPIIVSACREERCVRIWNYSAKKCELRWDFGEEPSGLAIHPLGYMIAVSFSDRLRFLHVLVNELKPYRELSVKNVRMVKFSMGGHLLAAAKGKVVVVYNTRTMKRVETLAGHSQQVISLCFDPEDRFLTTCAQDGSLCEWSTQTWNKIKEFSPTRPTEALALAGGGMEGHVVCCVLEGSKSFLRTFRHCLPADGETEEDIELYDDSAVDGPLRLNSLCHHFGSNGITVLAATSTGTLWSCSGVNTIPSMDKFGLHEGPCVAVCLSADARTIATAGDDGTIFVLRASGLAEAAAIGSRRSAEGIAGGEIVMINRGEIQARQEEIEMLSAECNTLKIQLSEEAAHFQSITRERVREARKRDQEQIQGLRLQYEQLQQAATAKERDNLRDMKQMEAKHVADADALEQKYDKRIKNESDRFMELEAEVKQLERLLEEKNLEAQHKLEQQKHQQQQQVADLIKDKDKDIQKLKDLIKFSQHRFDTMLDQEAIDDDLESSEISKRNHQELEEQRMVEYKLKKEQDTLLRGLDMMEKEHERIMTEQTEAGAQVFALKQESEQLQGEVEGLKAERKERETLLRDKELEIGSYKVKVSTLKKFKHVLDFRLKEVTLSLQPRDETINRLNAQLKELEAEFERQLEVQKQMEQVLEQKKAQINEVIIENKRLGTVVTQREKTISRFQNDLHKLSEEQDLRRWPQGIRKIYRDHVDSERVSKDDEDLGMQELDRQIQVVQQKASSLAEKGKSTEMTCKSDIMQKMHDNSLLIQELNELRVEKKMLLRQTEDLELRVRQGERKILDRQAAEARSTGGGQAAILDGRPGSRGALGSPGSSLRVSGPKQQSALPYFSGDGAPKPTVLPGSLKKKRNDPHMPVEERKEVQKLLAQADLNQQQIQMQRLEHKLLSDQLEKMMQERSKPGSASGASGAAATSSTTALAAGAGLRAARLRPGASDAGSPGAREFESIEAPDGRAPVS